MSVWTSLDVLSISFETEFLKSPDRFLISLIFCCRSLLRPVRARMTSSSISLALFASVIAFLLYVRRNWSASSMPADFRKPGGLAMLLETLTSLTSALALCS